MFHAVRAAIAQVVEASRPGGNQKGGVVWHTQGSGKSFSMLFYAGRVVRHPPMQNPTIVVLTDRNDLDDQLFGQFQRCHEILGQMPVQAASRERLRELLIAEGVDPERVRARGYGEELPLESNSTEEGRAANRRIEIRRIEAGDGNL